MAGGGVGDFAAGAAGAERDLGGVHREFRHADERAVVHGEDHRGGLRAGDAGRRGAGGAVQPEPDRGIRAVSLRGDPAGDAGGGDRAAAADLDGLRARQRRADRAGLDHRLLHGVVEHGDGPALGGSQFDRPAETVWGVALADPVAGSGTALGLGWIITLAPRSLDTAEAFAALALLSTLGIAILFAMTALEWVLLHRWHDSAVKKQG